MRSRFAFWTQSESLDEMRERILEETSVYITECLRRPELAVRIPIIRCGTGSFPPSLARAFWDRVLFDE
jgi:hypothetical protein